MSTAPRFTELRPGTAADLPAVAAVMADAFDPRFGEAWTTAQCLGMLAMPGSWLTLALDDGMLAGFALARSIAGEGELLLLAVHPAFHRRGMGAALLRATIDTARARATDTLHIEVRAGNPAAALYRAHGFTQSGARRDYYRGNRGEKFDAHSYALVLSSMVA